MTYRWLGLPGLAAAIVLGVGSISACEASDGNTSKVDAGSSSIQFEAGGVLTLAPKETATLELNASGVQNATISLAGNYFNAFLDADTVDLASGHGTVTLRAPSSPTTFSILATSGNVSARLDVAVSATGFATVGVTMAYQGKRAVPSVAASAFVETTCAQIGSKAVDGAPLVVGTSGEKLLLDSIPTDGQVAIKVRIAHYATGCLDLPSLTPNETHDVTVDVFDLPLDLAQSSLETRFTFAPDPADQTALANYFTQWVDSTVLNASFSASVGEAARLLDAMAAASGSPDFSAARTKSGWDSQTTVWLSQHSPSMHDRIAKWLTEAAQAGPGDLTGHLDGDASNPLFTPKMIGQLDAKSIGIAAPLPFAWSGQADDVLSISGAVFILPSRLACAAADLRARADVPASTGVADAVSIGIDCAGLGNAIAQSGFAFDTCDGACMGGLCTTAIANLWSTGAASLAKASDALSLSLSVAAPARVVDTPQVQSYAGSWVGKFGVGPSSVATKGVAKGAYGALPN